MVLRWCELTGKDFEKLKPQIAILPVGTVERHGDHLPLGTDNIVPEWLAERVAERLENAVVLPPVKYGVSITLAKFPGTISIPPEAFMNYVKHIMLEVVRNGIKYLVVINGHGGNTRELQVISKEVAAETEASVLLIDWWRDVAQDKRFKIFQYPGHAGEDETSAIMAIRPELVKMEHAEDHVMPYPRLKIYSRVLEDKLFPRAVNGKATLASAEKGKEFLNAVIADIIKAVEEFTKLVA